MSAIELTEGILKKYYSAIKENLFDKMSVQMHCDTYRGEHDLGYAEPEFSGKYIDICSSYYINEHDEKALEYARKVTYAAMKAQRDDGYMGMYMKGYEFGSFSVWNQAFTLFGMLKYYEITHDKKVLESVERCASYLIDSFKKRDILEAANNGSQNLCITLPIAMLYGITKNKKYDTFIQSVKDILKNSDMNLINPTDILKLRSQKGIEILVAYIGLMTYAMISDDEEIINGACMYWEQLNETQIRNTGGATVYELFVKDGGKPAFLPIYIKPNENCVTVGWIELSLMLFYVKKEAKYLDAAETALFNHELAAISKNSDDFCYYQPNFGKKIQGTPDQYYSCCRYRGLTLFAHMKELLYYDNKDEIVPMIFAPSIYENDNLIIEQKTDYPQNNIIEFIIEPKKKTELNLKLRLPSWCDKAKIFINDQEIYLTPCYGFDKYFDNFFRIDKIIENKIHIRYELYMDVKIESAKIFDSHFAALHYGPLVMALDSRFGTKLENIEINTKNNNFKREQAENEMVKISNGNCIFVDYASAGTTNPETDEFSVWVRKNDNI